MLEDLYKDSMLTTLDNPYNPFTEYDDWLGFDTSKGYNTNSYLARIVQSSDELSDEDQDLAISRAISEILMYNVTGNYVAVTKENFKDRSKEVETS